MSYARKRTWFESRGDTGYSFDHDPPVAQSVEREAYTFVVLGSSPSRRTKSSFPYSLWLKSSSPNYPTYLHNINVWYFLLRYKLLQSFL